MSSIVEHCNGLRKILPECKTQTKNNENRYQASSKSTSAITNGDFTVCPRCLPPPPSPSSPSPPSPSPPSPSASSYVSDVPCSCQPDSSSSSPEKVYIYVKYIHPWDFSPFNAMWFDLLLQLLLHLFHPGCSSDVQLLNWPSGGGPLVDPWSFIS